VFGDDFDSVMGTKGFFFCIYRLVWLAFGCVVLSFFCTMIDCLIFGKFHGWSLIWDFGFTKKKRVAYIHIHFSSLTPFQP